MDKENYICDLNFSKLSQTFVRLLEHFEKLVHSADRITSGSGLANHQRTNDAHSQKASENLFYFIVGGWRENLYFFSMLDCWLTRQTLLKCVDVIISSFQQNQIYVHIFSSFKMCSINKRSSFSTKTIRNLKSLKLNLW